MILAMNKPKNLASITSENTQAVQQEKTGMNYFNFTNLCIELDDGFITAGTEQIMKYPMN